MTTFKESAVVTEVDSTVLTENREWANPWSVSVPKDYLARSFVIKTFNWTPGISIQTVPLIGLLSQSTLALALFKLWRYARCSFKIQFKMTSSQYFQGCAMVGWLPCISWSTVPHDLQSLSCYNAVVLSASKQESCTLIIPYLSPEFYMDTTAFNSTSAEHATVFFAELNTLLSTNAAITPSVPMEVHGSIEECDLSGAMSQSKVSRRDAEAEKKEQMGKDAAVGSVIRNTSQLIRHVPVIGEVWSPIADVINTIFGTQLSKPVTVAAPSNNVQRYYSDVNQADGLTDATQMTFYQNPRISVSKTFYGMNTSFMSCRKFAGEPMLFDQVTFDGTTTVYLTSLDPTTTGLALSNIDFVGMMASSVRFYRGSLKYLIHFALPCFYAVRFRIRIQYNTTVSNPHNVPNIVIDVKGDVWIPITVPMMQPRPWVDNDGTNYTPSYLVIEQITPIVGAPSPTTAVVYCNIWRAGGEDMQFAYPWDPSFFIFRTKTERKTSVVATEEEDLSRAHPQTCIKEKFAHQFDPIQQGQAFIQEKNFIMSETIETIADLFKRQTLYADETHIFGDTPQVTLHKLFASCFMWQRGSVVYRHIHRGNTSGNKDGWYLPPWSFIGGAHRPEMGWAPAYQSATQMIQQEAINMPYWSAAPYTVSIGSYNKVLGSSQRVVPVRPVLSLGTKDEVTLAAGDDFMMMFLVPWGNQIGLLAKKPSPKTTKHIDKGCASTSS